MKKIRINFDKILAYCLTFFVKKKIKSLLFYVFLVALPKIIPPIVLIIDCFINHKIVFFYKVLPLMLLPLIYRYIIYAYNNHYIYHSNILDNRIFIYNEDLKDYLLTSEYIEGLFDATSNNTTFSCTFDLQETYVRDTCEKANIHVFYFDRIACLDYLKIILTNLFLNYNFVQNLRREKYTYDTKITLVITSIYLICWAYILTISFHTLDPLDLEDFISLLLPKDSNPFI